MTAPNLIIAWRDKPADRSGKWGDGPVHWLPDDARWYAAVDPAVLASLPEVQAMIGAVMEEARQLVGIWGSEDGPDIDPVTGPTTDYKQGWLDGIDHAQEQIRTLHPDALTALEAYRQRVLDEALSVADDMLDAMRIKLQMWEDDDDLHDWVSPAKTMIAEAAAIRAMKGPKP